MKLLNIILSIYLVLLSCMPCADMEAQSVMHSSAEYAATHDNHSHNREKEDMCSPFCICNCCGTQILNYQPELTFDWPTIIKVVNATEPFYKSAFSSNFYGSVWQPPQIV